MTQGASAVDMERALLGCTTHVSGVLVTWNRIYNEGGRDGLRQVGAQLLERSEARQQAAASAGNDRNVRREAMLQPFIRIMFGVREDHD